MRPLVAHLYRRIMRRGRLIGLTILSSIPAVVFAVAVATAAGREEASIIYAQIITSVGYTFAIAALVLTVATLREERESGTLPYIYMRPYSRFALAVGSIIAGAAAAATLAVIAWLITVIAGLLVGAGPSVTFPGLAMFLPAALGYAVVFVPLGYLFSRSLLVGLAYILVGESILAFAIPGIAQISIWRISMSIYGTFQDAWVEDSPSLGPITIGAGGGIAKLAVVLVLGTALLTWALRKRDAL